MNIMKLTKYENIYLTKHQNHLYHKNYILLNNKGIIKNIKLMLLDSILDLILPQSFIIDLNRTSEH